MIPCLYKKIAGFDCPGCGLQRSILFLLKGDLQSSLQMYWATIPILLMFAYCGLHLMYHFKNGTRNLVFLFVFNAVLIICHYIYKLSHHL